MGNIDDIVNAKVMSAIEELKTELHAYADKAVQESLVELSNTTSKQMVKDLEHTMHEKISITVKEHFKMLIQTMNALF